MRLRNKKTGEIMDLECITIFDRPDKYNTGDAVDEFYTIDDLNECWEDYTPKEPLIKDEKIRKAVRAWAEVNGIKRVSYDSCWNAFRCADFVIAFDYDFDRHDGLTDGVSYTIAELCGEEENERAEVQDLD